MGQVLSKMTRCFALCLCCFGDTIEEVKAVEPAEVEAAGLDQQGLSQTLASLPGSPRPELHYSGSADSVAVITESDDGYSTAEIAANSPRYRRRSSTFIDGVHDVKDEKASPMAPAQLYSTMSGRLFHSGRICIVLVGLPARGKT